MKKTILYLSWSPTVNNYYSHTRRGIYISKRGKAYLNTVISDVREQAPDVYIDYKISLTVYMFPPDRRVRDLDNYLKAMQDSVTKSGFWEDDSLIDQLFVKRGEVVKGGAMVIIIQKADDLVRYADMQLLE